MEKLKNKVKELSGYDLDIKKILIAQIGCVPICGFELPDLNCKNPIKFLEENNKSDSDSMKDYSILANKIIKSLKDHPNIFNVEECVLESPNISMPEELGIILQGDISKVEVKLPNSSKKYKQDSKKEFQTMINGSLYMSFAQLDKYPYLPYIGNEFREILQKQIDNETNFYSSQVGPSPIHPLFYIVFCENHSELTTTNLYSDGKDIYFIVNDNNDIDIDNVILKLFFKIKGVISLFYSLKLKRHLLINYNIEIKNLFNDLTNILMKLYSSQWWEIFKKNNLIGEAKNKLLTIHKRMMKFESVISRYNIEKKEFLDILKSNHILKEVNDYFVDQSNLDIEMNESLRSSLSYFNSKVKTFENVKMILISSLLGAIVGSLLTILLA